MGHRHRRASPASTSRLLLPLALLLAPQARGADLGDELGRLESAAEARLNDARAVEQRLSAATGSLDRTLGVERFQDAVGRFLLEDYEPAAETFFVLVASGVLDGTGLDTEAEFYLGESLHGLGFDGMAEDTYESILARRDHPFRSDAVRRLLEIYARDADPARFERLFQREIVQRGVAPTDLVLYSVGKTLRARHDVARAKSYLLQIEPKSEFWARSRYQIGAMLVEQGDLPALREAIGVFREVALLDPRTDDDRKVRDLALLALGRLHDHLKEYPEATQAYVKIAEDSPYRADQLHELTWLYIEQGASGLALETVQQFLDAFPDHPFAADLRLVEAQLQFDRGDFDGAVATYDGVAGGYAPLRDRFDRLAGAEAEARLYLGDVLAAVAEPDAAGDTPADLDAGEVPAAPGAATDGPEPLPAFARAVMRQDPAFGRAVELWSDVSGTTEAVGAAEAIVGELEGALAAADGDDLLDASRFATLEGRVRGLSDRLALLGLEQQWLEGAGGHADLGGLDARRRAADAALSGLAGRVDTLRAALDARIAAPGPDSRVATREGADGAAVDAASLAEAKADGALAALPELEGSARDQLPRLEAEVEALATAYRGLRPALGIDVQMDPTSVRVDALDASLRQAITRLEGTASALAGLDAGELRRVQDVFSKEAQAVRDERVDLGREQQDTEAVASDVVRANFRRLADLFGERVLKAEMGAVNVFWTRWVQAGEERKALADERTRAIVELQGEFDEIERKLGEGH